MLILLLKPKATAKWIPAFAGMTKLIEAMLCQHTSRLAP
jgi:hypothetical protein